MVGPIENNKYYCRGKEYGYCDVRTGTCYCNQGYKGLACEECDPTHVMIGALCYPRKFCLNGCSNAGDCDFLTGKCECHEHRTGDDCSLPICQRYDPFCHLCDDKSCVECLQGYSVELNSSIGKQCNPCSRYDPRCLYCDDRQCLQCVDLLLSSIRRSGRRVQDRELPEDELERELSFAIPFGGQDPRMFYDAEAYYVVKNLDVVPLKDYAMSCTQGTQNDSSLRCNPKPISHIICGNYGTITLSSPEYEVTEDSGYILIKIERTGGGLGNVSVRYSILHDSTTFSDLSPSAQYTSNQKLEFGSGVIEILFQIPINDDRELEGDETFVIHLHDVEGGAHLGNQNRAVVTIKDDDDNKTCTNLTHIPAFNMTEFLVGESVNFELTTRSCLGQEQSDTHDSFVVKASYRQFDLFKDFLFFSFARAKGVYSFDLNLKTAGMYDLRVFYLIPGGLKGSYFDDYFFSGSEITLKETTRTDSILNFTWGTGPVSPCGRDLVSVRWIGFIRPDYNSTYSFFIHSNDHVRAWVNNRLIFDRWDPISEKNTMGSSLYMEGDKFYPILIEYREMFNNASIQLLWSSNESEQEVIPSSALYYSEETYGFAETISIAPFSIDILKSDVEGGIKGIVGEPFIFKVIPRDAYKNSFFAFEQVDASTKYLEMTKFQGNVMSLSNCEETISISFTYSTDMFASFTTRLSGTHQVNITYGETQDHIFGSPFLIESSSSETFATSSNIATGGIIYEFGKKVDVFFSGFKYFFLIISRDEFENMRETGGDNWQVIVRASGQYKREIVYDHNNGTYTASFEPNMKGPNEISVTLDGIHLNGSPFTVEVLPNKAHGPLSFVSDNLENLAPKAAFNNALEVVVVDEWSNMLDFFNITENIVNVIFVSHDGGDTFMSDGNVTSFEKGKIKILFSPIKSGTGELFITINNDHIVGSPFSFDVIPGDCSVSKSIIQDLTPSSIAGNFVNFTIQGRDANENNQMNDTCNITVLGELISATEVSHKIEIYPTYIGDGKYHFEHRFLKAGTYWITLRDKPPAYSINVLPGPASANNSLVSVQYSSFLTGFTAELSIGMKDIFGNNLEKGGNTIDAILLNQNDTLIMSQRLKDNNDGTYEGNILSSVSPSAINIELYEQGGLWGEYIAADDFDKSHLSYFYADSEIDMNWGDDHPSHFSNSCWAVEDLGQLFTKSPALSMIDSCLLSAKETLGPDRFSIIWTGFIFPEHPPEEYVFAISCDEEGDAGLVIDGIEVIKYGPCIGSRRGIHIMDRPSKYYSIELRYSHNRLRSFINFKWSSLSQGELHIVPSSNLFRKLLVGGKPLSVSLIE